MNRKLSIKELANLNTQFNQLTDKTAKIQAKLSEYTSWRIQKFTEYAQNFIGRYFTVKNGNGSIYTLVSIKVVGETIYFNRHKVGEGHPDNFLTLTGKQIPYTAEAVYKTITHTIELLKDSEAKELLKEQLMKDLKEREEAVKIIKQKLRSL